MKKEIKNLIKNLCGFSIWANIMENAKEKRENKINI